MIGMPNFYVHIFMYLRKFLCTLTKSSSPYILAQIVNIKAGKRRVVDDQDQQMKRGGGIFE